MTLKEAALERALRSIVVDARDEEREDMRDSVDEQLIEEARHLLGNLHLLDGLQPAEEASTEEDDDQLAMFYATRGLRARANEAVLFVCVCGHERGYHVDIADGEATDCGECACTQYRTQHALEAPLGSHAADLAELRACQTRIKELEFQNTSLRERLPIKFPDAGSDSVSTPACTDCGATNPDREEVHGVCCHRSSEAVTPEGDCPLCEGTGTVPESAYTGKTPPEDDDWNTATRQNFESRQRPETPSKKLVDAARNAVSAFNRGIFMGRVVRELDEALEAMPTGSTER